MDSAVIQLPGGFRVGDAFYREVEMREMSGAEEEIILDQRKSDGSKGKSLKSFPQRITEALARCTVRVGDKFVETNRDPEKAQAKHFMDLWQNALAGDRGVALIRLRQMSLGNMFVFKEVCPNCRREIPRVSYDLSEVNIEPYFKNIEREVQMENPDATDEEVTALAEERRAEKFTSEDTFTLTLPKSGTEITFRLLTGKDEDRLENLTERYGDALITALISLRLVTIDGQAIGGNLKHPKIKYLALNDREFLRHYFDEAEGGVDTSVDIECDGCGATFTRRLQVMQPGFFIRSVA